MRSKEAARKMKASLEWGAELVVLAETAVLSQPKVRLDHPAPRQDVETFCASLRRTVQAQRALPKAFGHQPAEFISGVTAVGPDEFEFGQWRVDLIKNQRGPVAILHARGVHADLQNQALGIHQQMAFAAHDLLSRIVAAHSAPASRPHALAIQDRGRGGFFFPLLIRAASRNASWSFQGSPAARQRAVVIDDAPRRQIVRR